MLWVTVEGVKPWDGRYPFDDTSDAGAFTTREWGWIKRYSGYLPLTIGKGWDGGDPELFSVFAAVAMYRAGKVTVQDVPDVIERFADAPFGATIRLENDDEEAEVADDGPPAAKPSVSSSSSGAGSTTSSETSPPTRSGSGTPASAGAASTPARLAS